MAHTFCRKCGSHIKHDNPNDAARDMVSHNLMNHVDGKAPLVVFIEGSYDPRPFWSFEDAYGSLDEFGATDAKGEQMRPHYTMFQRHGTAWVVADLHTRAADGFIFPDGAGGEG